MKVSKKDSSWEIADLYKRSWHIVKKQKVLWIFAAALAGTGTSGISNVSRLSRFSGKTDSKMFERLFQNYHANPPVLGDSTSSFFETFKHLLSQIPPFLYILLGVELLAALLIGVFIALVKKAWATGSLLEAIELANKGKDVSIEQSSTGALKHVRALMWLLFAPSFLLGIIAVVLIAVFILGIVFGNGILKIVSIVLLIITFLSFFVFSILLSLSSIWASRQIMVDAKSGRQALFEGFRLMKKKLWPMILLGLVNTVCSFLIFGVLIGVFAGLIIGGFLNFQNNSFLGFGLLGSGILGIIVFAIFTPVLSGIITAFKTSTWSLAYHVIRKKYDSQ